MSVPCTAGQFLQDNKCVYACTTGFPHTITSGQINIATCLKQCPDDHPYITYNGQFPHCLQTCPPESVVSIDGKTCIYGNCDDGSNLDPTGKKCIKNCPDDFVASNSKCKQSPVVT